MSFSLIDPGPGGDQDRMHAYLDLTNVTDAASAGRFVLRWRRALEDMLASAGRFVLRWRRALEDMLASDEPARLAAELEEATDAANNAEAARDRLLGWIENDWLPELDDLQALAFRASPIEAAAIALYGSMESRLVAETTIGPDGKPLKAS